MPNDLVFDRPPLSGSPVELVFGNDVAVPSDAVYASGRIALPSFVVLGTATTTRPPTATASGSIALPAFMLFGAVRYDSAVSRSLVGKVSARWQVARQVDGGAVARHQGADRARVGRVATWQRATSAAGSVTSTWQDALRNRASAEARYQAALQLEASTRNLYQEAGRAQRGVGARWQEAERLATAPVGVRHQEATRLLRGVRSRWQEALRLQARHRDGFGAALQVDVGRMSRWQAAMYPLPGHSVVEPPIDTPCYVPSTALVFRDKQKYSTNLIFVCEGHGGEPGQPPLFIPLLRVYMTTHYMEAVMLPSLERVPLEDVTIEADVGMPHWKLTATGPLGLMDMFPLNSPPTLVRVTVDGLPWVFAISPAGRSRVPGLRRARIVGRSVSALAGATSMADQIWLNNAPATAQQVVTAALQFTDIAVDWQIPDWLLPAGAWSFRGKPLAAAVRVAEAVGAVLQSHPTEPTLQFMPRYATLPWEWDSASVTPDVSIASHALAADDYDPDEQPLWEAVYVFGGATQGVGRRVVRGGTAGIVQAPQQVDDLITDHVAAVERGRSILGAGGTQALASMSLPILTGGTLPGVLRVNQLLEVVEPTETWRGLVRAVTVRAGPSEVRQAVRVERHFE
ncbi:hypothetical protein ACSFA7_14230 [Variovorax sp. LT1R20]|uniref:hypothetical protein n=1 Tax=Variovorax sp. LT1R20 TaxID=3443729 RepID=UPI003F48F390